MCTLSDAYLYRMLTKIRKLWVITKPGLEKVWALRIKKGCVSVLTQPQILLSGHYDKF